MDTEKVTDRSRTGNGICHDTEKSRSLSPTRKKATNKVTDIVMDTNKVTDRSRTWQCHGRQFGSAKNLAVAHGFDSATDRQFGSVTDLAVPPLEVPWTAVWQYHGSGSATFGSAADLAVPRTAVWQCH